MSVTEKNYFQSYPIEKLICTYKHSVSNNDTSKFLCIKLAKSLRQ